jgi:hypothetical protein
MALCEYCNHDMSDNTVISCEGNTIVEFPDGVTLPGIPYDPPYGGKEQRCHDCGIMRGGFHHPGCDMEKCPRCPHDNEGNRRQLISCGCLDYDEVEVEVDIEPEVIRNSVAMETRCFIETVMRDIFKQDLSEVDTLKLCEKVMKTLPKFES